MSEKTIINNIIDQLKTLTLLEAAELVKEIETVFGVDASVSVGAVSVAPAAAAAVATEAVEEKTAFDLILSEVPNVPKLLKEGLSKEECDKVKKEIEEVGGKVNIK